MWSRTAGSEKECTLFQITTRSKPQPYGFRVGRRTSAPWRRALPLLQHAVLFVAAGADAAERVGHRADRQLDPSAGVHPGNRDNSCLRANCPAQVFDDLRHKSRLAIFVERDSEAQAPFAPRLPEYPSRGGPNGLMERLTQGASGTRPSQGMLNNPLKVLTPKMTMQFVVRGD